MDDKHQVRVKAHATRARELDRDAKSDTVRYTVEALEEYRSARIVAGYVGIKSEVQTRALLEDRLARHAETAVVYREGPTLELCLIRTLDELELTSFGLWEPRPDLRLDPERRCPTEDVDLFLVPGLAFDLHGGRIGYGRGYYDSLLCRAASSAHTVGLAFESQIIDQVPMSERDVPVQIVVTEVAVHRAI